MHSSVRSKIKNAISRAALIGVVVIIIVVILIGAYAALTLSQTSSSTTSSTQSSSTSTQSSSVTSSSSSSSTSTSSSPPITTLTYETTSTVQYLDPQVSYDLYGANIEANIYEPLLWYSGANGSVAIPWLASNYSISSDGKTMTLNLRNNVTFADGEQFNSSAAYFSLNRLLIFDGSSPSTHGTQASWIIQQLENTSLSTTLCCAQNYSAKWASEVIGQNFVQITGPFSITLHIQNPNFALPYLLSNIWADMVAPDWVMQKDISLWTSNGYTLPYPSPSGNATTAENQYLYDFVATCNTGATLAGCAATYLEQPVSGSLAGTGPYTLQSFTPSTNDLVLKMNPNFWGGPKQVKPTIQTVDINYVQLQNTRTVDLQNAARSGQAMVIDVAGNNLYSVADRTQWLENNTLVSSIPGVSIYGPYNQYYTEFDVFGANVTNPVTGTFYQFQPFADLRVRLAFADAVNMSDVNVNVNNKLGLVANEVIPPGFPPAGSYNSSITPRYSYNLTAVQDLLLAAMEQPLTQFTFKNGTAAPPGLFNNTFGCSASALSANGGRCASPVGQQISLDYATGATVDDAIITQIATAINNVSTTYNMGLTVSITPIPLGQLETLAFAGKTYLWAESLFGWVDDYPWATDFLGPILSPSGLYEGPAGFNFAQMQTYWTEAQHATAVGDITTLVHVTNQMAEFSNQEVTDLWTLYPDIVIVSTSNVHGFYFNPAIYTTGAPEYYAALSIS